MRILIANDDGYLAPASPHWCKACEGLGEIEVVAPEHNTSGNSNALTLTAPLYVFTPAATTAFATSTARQRTACTSRSRACSSTGPTWCVSGINNGANMGDDTIYSGTVAAAMEGYLFGIPAIAFSQIEKGWARARRRRARGARHGRAASLRARCASGRAHGCST